MVDLWPLTGRGEELRVLGEALAHSEHKGVVVAGQAGVGKTRLSRAAADTATRSGWAVRRVAGTATGQALTLGAFARWADVGDASPLALARTVFARLTEGTDGAPLLLLVDDAHLLDDLSALIVHQLVIQDVARVIATIRTGYAAPDAVTALWKDGQLRRLELQPLSRNETDHLLDTVLDGPVSVEAAERMWTLSRGNVLFLHHLVEHERESGRLDVVDGEWCLTATPLASPSLVELVEMQVGTVPDEVGEVVDLVAIAEPIDQGVLGALTDPRWIDAAEQRGLITADGDAVFVGHPLYGEIRISQCGPMRLARLRGRVATAMKAAEEVDPLRLRLTLVGVRSAARCRNPFAGSQYRCIANRPEPRRATGTRLCRRGFKSVHQAASRPHPVPAGGRACRRGDPRHTQLAKSLSCPASSTA